MKDYLFSLWFDGEIIVSDLTDIQAQRLHEAFGCVISVQKPPSKELTGVEQLDSEVASMPF